MGRRGNEEHLLSALRIENTRSCLRFIRSAPQKLRLTAFSAQYFGRAMAPDDAFVTAPLMMR